MARIRTAVLISGRGSNLGALLDAAADPSFPAAVDLVVSDRPEAAGLARATASGAAVAVLDYRQHAGKAAFEAALDALLRGRGIELVCLAGFMRLFSADFVEAWRDRLLNIHPSLLPAFRGLATHERALAAGVRIHGATVHFVRAAVDDGPIIVQGAVPVLPGDTPGELGARVLAVEHRIYPLALHWVASGAARVDGDRVAIAGAAAEADATLVAPCR